MEYVKICGLKKYEDVLLCIEYGADAVGLICLWRERKPEAGYDCSGVDGSGTHTLRVDFRVSNIVACIVGHRSRSPATGGRDIEIDFIRGWGDRGCLPWIDAAKGRYDDGD